MKTQITVEIPDGYEITSIYRGNQYGEHDDRSAAIPYTIHIRPAKPFLINGVPSEWPEWLACDWVAKEKDGAIYGYTGGPPEIRAGIWTTVSGGYLGRIFGTTLEIPGPFEQSLRENPRRKK